MKRVFSIILPCVLAALCLCSCNKSKDQNLPDILILSPSGKSVISAGADITVKITANYTVTAQCPESWIHLHLDAGSCIVSVDEYKGDVIRKADIVFTTEKGASAVFSLTQFSSEQEDTITVDPHEANVNEKGGEVDVAVSAYYEVHCESAEKWVNAVKLDKSKFKVTVEANPAAVTRTARLKFITALGASDELVITQDAADIISVDVKSKTVSADAESFDVQVTSVYDYTASSDVSWAHVEALADGKYRISIDENRISIESRVATISFTSSRGAVATVVVTQGGFEDKVSLSVTSVEATEYGARVNVTVSSNYAVTPSTVENWIMVKGSGFSYVVDVQRNETSQAREGTVTFTSIHGASASMTVKQKAGVAPGEGSVLPFIDVVDIDYD